MGEMVRSLVYWFIWLKRRMHKILSKYWMDPAYYNVASWKMANIIVIQWYWLLYLLYERNSEKGMQWRQLHVIVITSRMINEKYWCGGEVFSSLLSTLCNFWKPQENFCQKSYFHLNTCDKKGPCRQSRHATDCSHCHSCRVEIYLTQVINFRYN